MRHDVAHLAGQTLHPLFESALAKLVVDDNARVSRAAEQASVRRRDSLSSSALGRQHDDKINAMLDDIEARFGLPGRQAVKRTAEQISHRFTRTVYHEVVRLLTPANSAADRLKKHLVEGSGTRESLIEDVDLIARRVAHLGGVLEETRAYAAPAKLSFAQEDVRDMLAEAADIVEQNAQKRGGEYPEIRITCEHDVAIEAARSRLIQAFTNLLENALEAYVGCDTSKPISVSISPAEGRVTITIVDAGAGMTAAALADATLLFATTKKNGTGFGLPWAMKIIESDHGGRLKLESTKGRGTTALITLPKRQLVERA